MRASRAAARTLVAAALLPAASCGQEQTSSRAGALACQQRIVAVRPPAQPPGSGAGPAFDGLRAAYAAIPLQGCTVAQRHAAATLAERAGRLADLGRRVGPLERAHREMSGIAPDPNLLSFMSELEGFDQRRRREADELRAMEAAGE
jgi:hypothetical protein